MNSNDIAKKISVFTVVIFQLEIANAKFKAFRD